MKSNTDASVVKAYAGMNLPHYTLNRLKKKKFTCLEEMKILRNPKSDRAICTCQKSK